MIQFIKSVFFFVSLLTSLHTHDFQPNASFVYYGKQACWCGASREVRFVPEPCTHANGNPNYGCLVLHGHSEYGPVIEVKPDTNTGFYLGSDGWHFVFRGRKIL